MPLTVTVDVPPRDREVLESWLRSSSLRAGLAQRARIVLLAGDGVAVKDIVERVGVSKPTVIGWKKRYAAEGPGGLEAPLLIVLEDLHRADSASRGALHALARLDLTAGWTLRTRQAGFMRAAYRWA